MKKLLDKTLCEICQEIQISEQRLHVIRKEKRTWNYWKLCRLSNEVDIIAVKLDLLYRQKLRILDLIDKYEADPIS